VERRRQRQMCIRDSLYIDKPQKSVFATNYPNYKNARRTNERVIYLDSLVLHESVARNEDDLRFKLENWGHNKDVNKDFLNKWISVNENNYQEMTNFYYIEPERWKKLSYFPTNKIQEIENIVANSESLKISKSFILFKNFGQWFNFLFK
jgi:hypothetical protein